MALTLISILTLVSTAVVAAPLPQNGVADPSGAPTPVPLPTPTCIMNLKSVAGETCDSIGQRFGITGADILAANLFLDCTNIWAGTPICVPSITYAPVPPVYVPPGCTSTYIVTHGGETCDTIGSRFGVSGSELFAANSFLNCQDIWLNTNLCIPIVGITDYPINPPTDGPSPSPTVSETPGCYSTYTVHNQGETCDSIAAQFGISGSDIKSRNDFLNCQDIWLYTQVCIPRVLITPPTVPEFPRCISTYTVHNQGETCDSIAAQFGISSSDISSSNDFLNCQDIWLYTQVCIPPVVVIDYFPSDGPTDSPSATISIAPVPLPTCANTYVVQNVGETCDSIGAQFGVSGPEILASNTFLDCQDIWLYTQICVPYPVISDSFTLASSSTTVI